MVNEFVDCIPNKCSLRFLSIDADYQIIDVADSLLKLRSFNFMTQGSKCFNFIFMEFQASGGVLTLLLRRSVS